jgi:dTMP kinase
MIADWSFNMIIAFVGIDGSGKTTLLSRFAVYLEEKGKKVQIIKALRPDSVFINNYNMIRNEFCRKHPDKKHEFNIISSYIMSFDLLQQSEGIKALNSDDTVIILDRWAICQQLYAKVWMAENDFSNIAYQMCFEPDLTFVIDADMNLIDQRLESRGGANEFENILSLRRLKKLYLKYARENEKAVLVQNNNEIIEAYRNIIKEYEKKNEK